MRKSVLAAAAVLSTLGAGGIVATISTGSSHREAPLTSADPLADTTDVYAFTPKSASGERSNSRCCPVVQIRESMPRVAARAWSTGPILRASGRVPMMDRILMKIRYDEAACEPYDNPTRRTRHRCRKNHRMIPGT